MGICSGTSTEWPFIPGEKPLGAEKGTNNKLNPHFTLSPTINPEPHRWKASALTTVPSLLPLSLTKSADSMLYPIQTKLSNLFLKFQYHLNVNTTL